MRKVSARFASQAAEYERGGGPHRLAREDYSIIHRSRRSFRDVNEAKEDIVRSYPGAKVGQLRPNPRFWSFEVILPPGVAPPVVEQKPLIVRKVPPGPSKEEGKSWCARCACEVPVFNARYQNHKSAGSSFICRGSGRLVSNQ